MPPRWMDLYSVFVNKFRRITVTMLTTSWTSYGRLSILYWAAVETRWRTSRFAKNLLNQKRRRRSLINASSAVSLLSTLPLEWLLLLSSATLVALLNHIKWPTLQIQYSFASSSTLVSCSCFAVQTWQSNLSCADSAYLLEACQISIQHGLIN